MPANPYHFGSPADDLHFTDRKRELNKLSTLMLNGQNLVLIAPRRYGKSSLLARAVKEVRARGGRSGRVSLMRCASEKDVAEALLKGVFVGPLSWLHGRTAELVQHLKRIRLDPQMKLDPISGLIVGVSFGPYTTDINWQDVISDVIRVLGNVSDDKHPVSMILDEFQKAYEISPNIPDLMKDIVDELPRVSFVFAGSKRHLMDAMATDPKRGALYNVGDKLYLQQIPEADFVGYLVDRAEVGGKTLTVAVAESIYQAAMGVPNDVQLLAFWAFESAEKVIDSAAVKVALRTAVADRADEFEEVFDALALSQQLLLKFIARTSVEFLSGSDVQKELRVSHTAARKAGDVIQRAELIHRHEGRWVISNGLFKEWLLDDQ
jgi:hypothetical protein